MGVGWGVGGEGEGWGGGGLSDGGRCVGTRFRPSGRIGPRPEVERRLVYNDKDAKKNINPHRHQPAAGSTRSSRSTSTECTVIMTIVKL